MRYPRPFLELPDQLLEQVAHGVAGDGVRAEADVSEPARYLVQRFRVAQPLDLRVEVEPVDDLPHFLGKPLT